ncbi:hypothetical protein [Parasynechococcus sp.]|uniref:hypothetical protein n=1 Tax=Parasynechococcus sp. TaxID=3101203 RepID=UPI0037045202
MLPDRRDEHPQQSWRQLRRRAFTLVLLELVLVLGGVGLFKSLSCALQAMDHSLQLVHRNGLKVLGLLGMLLSLPY